MQKYIILIIIGIAAGLGIYLLWQPKQANTINSNNNSNTMALPYGEHPSVTVKTNLGDIELELFAKDAPETAANFIKLAKSGFYDGTKFHRVIPNFMIQGGDPNSKDDNWANDGQGGPGYSFKDEINNHKLVRGTLAMANAGPDTNGSQFFIVTADATPWLDGHHTAFGQVTKGMDIVSAIEKLPRDRNDHPTKDATIMEIVIK